MSTPVVLFVSLLLFMIVGVPVAWSLSLSCIAALLTMDGMPLVLLTQRVFTGANNFSFLAVPAFIIAGEVMSQGGISKRLVDMTSVLLGRVRGSLGIISVVASTIFAALSGSATATTAAIGGLMYPEMERRGYPKDFSAAVQAIGGSGICPAKAVRIYVTPPKRAGSAWEVCWYDVADGTLYRGNIRLGAGAAGIRDHRCCPSGDRCSHRGYPR